MARKMSREKEIRVFEYREDIRERLTEASKLSNESILYKYHSSMDGLNEAQVEANLETFGANIVSKDKQDTTLKRLYEAFINPFTVILMVLVGVSFLSDVILVAPGEKDFTTIIIISAMVFMSGILRFVQESRSDNAAEKLKEMIETTTKVKRLGENPKEIPLDEVVVGDIIYFSAGDMIPADMRVLSAKDLFVNQGSLTGESEPVEKFAVNEKEGSLTETSNLIFMGSNVISGSAVGIVLMVGDDTMFGSIVDDVNQKAPQTSFEKGINQVSWVLIRFMLVMVPVVFVINGITKQDWLSALMFAISIAVGLTPEMLPMITTTSLAKGAVAMSKKKVIVKNINSIQNFGAMNILCTDKTGTITLDKVVLQYNLDVHGNEDDRVLRHAFLNSYYQTGLKNFIDLAIIEKSKQKDIDDIVINRFEKVDEIPFDFNRRRMSVVVSDKEGKTQLITKGAVEEILEVCSYVEYHGVVEKLTDDSRDKVLKVVEQLNREGMRVIGLAQKSNPDVVGAFGTKDEADMVLIGYLAFLDPPKETTEAAIRALTEYGVEVKVLTGDNDLVTKSICKKVGMDVDQILLGSDLDNMSDVEVMAATKTVDVFAKLSPSQKARLVSLMKEDGNVVGFMGDGINDAPAMNQADIGISVDTAVDIAKESADIILLEKDLMILEKGIVEGRRTYANMIKYIKMTASSNFGNMFSVLVASAFIPFLPMAAVQLILLNLVYDLSCTAIPWDNVDAEYLKKPKNWDASGISSFMKWIGPTSSVFDITTYILLYFVICPAATGGLLFHQIHDPATQALYIAIFQTGWLIESMWTQTLVVHMIRTPKIPFIQSRASFPVMLFTVVSIAVMTMIPYTGFGEALQLTPLPLVYYGWLLLTVVMYMILVTIVKHIYIKRHGELL